MDVLGNFYSTWVDPQYVLQFSRSTDSGATWSAPVEIGAPAGILGTNKTMGYLPTLRQHPTTPGRAVLAYYGSQDGGATYNGFIAETGNINSPRPVFSSIVGNNVTQPLQGNMDKMWDQGYVSCSPSTFTHTSFIHVSYESAPLTKTCIPGRSSERSDRVHGRSLRSSKQRIPQGHYRHGICA